MAKTKDPKKAKKTTKANDDAPKLQVEPDAPKPKLADERGGFGVPSEKPVVKEAEPKVQLKNVWGRPIDVELEHDVYCVEVDRCVCAVRSVIRFERVERGSKEQVPRRKDIKLPMSFRLAPGQTSGVLHEAATRCADVKNHSKCKPMHLKVIPA
jgi:hypothetical protein